MDVAKLNRLRSKAQRLSRERFALVVFSQVMTIDLRRRFELEEGELKRSSITKLRQFIAKLDAEIAAIRRSMGARVPGSELVEILADAERAPAGKSLLLTKSDIKQLFSNYHK